MKLLRCKQALGRYPASVGKMLRDRSRRFKGRPVFSEREGGRESTWLWEDLHGRVERVGASLLALGLGPGDVAAIYSRNRGDMLVFELAAMSVGAVACPIFAGYPAEPLGYILEHSGARLLAVSDERRLETALSTEAGRRLERVFVMDPFEPREGPPRVRPFAELLDPSGVSAFGPAVSRVRADDPALLMYTSGTSGRPKGVLLSHRNILSQRKALELVWRLEPGGRVLSYLPWHHSFGGIFELFTALDSGAHLTVDESYGKDLALLVENFKRVKPTVYFSVPRIHQALVEEARRDPASAARIFHPELRFVFTAAAALPSHVAEAYRRRGVPVVEGWGLTETAPCVTLTRFDQPRAPGAVGFPLPGTAVRVADDGEIQVKGPNVMLGYYKEAERTRRAFTEDRWLKTGDYGELSEKGLVLKCRHDGMFKLSNGEMVISQTVELALASSPLVQYALVVGSGRDHVGALVFPNVRELFKEMARRGLRPGPCAPWGGEGVSELIAAELDRVLLDVPEKYARPTKVVLVCGEPSLDNRQLTPTMKLVRSKLLEDYAPEAAGLFAAGEFGRCPGTRVITLRWNSAERKH
ncbi:MAG: AMP-binding protein [Elusimicrobia bacterium]|nr:AMP-binding protein [Elusimicrobiota bacterium]